MCEYFKLHTKAKRQKPAQNVVVYLKNVFFVSLLPILKKFLYFFLSSRFHYYLRWSSFLLLYFSSSFTLSLFAMCMYASYNILYVYKCECAWTFFFCLTFIMLTFYPLEVFFFRFVLVCTKNSGVDRNRTSNDNNIKKRWRKSKDKSTKQQAACTTQCCIRILKEQQQECFQFQVKLVIAQPTTKEIRGMQRMLFGKSRN